MAIADYNRASLKAQSRPRRPRAPYYLIVMCGMALAACQMAPQGSRVAPVVERDVEMPEIYNQQGSGLWAGNETLGGVWVATQEQTDPERVIIRNLDNGNFVIGAMFSRPDGSAFLYNLSSDAAEALGMRAGQANTLEVTALKREAIEEAPISTDGTNTIPLDIAQEIERDMAAAQALQSQSAIALAKPFIQVGIFASEANARRAHQALNDSGIAAQTRLSQIGAKSYWRVVAGPSADAAAQSASMSKIRALGFKDAFETVK